MEVKPDITPRCDCGQVTEWYWDNDPEIYPPGQGEWIPRNCWHCTAVLIMKWDRTAAKMGLTPDGGLLPAKVDRFVELITKQSTFPKVLITTREWPES